MSRSTAFTDALQQAIRGGVIGAAIVDRGGQLIDWVGASEDDEESSVANLVALLEDDNVLESLLRGALGVLALGDTLSTVVAIAKRELYVVAMVADSADTTIDTVRELRDRVALVLPDPPRGSGASGAGPAELQVVELGITVPRRVGTGTSSLRN
jgi:hypothetical protein